MKYSLLLLFISITTFAQTSLQPGIVTPAVKLTAQSDVTHAVYLPRAYDSSKSYRTIFFFEERGLGAAAVQQFTIAAELTNSIVVAQNRPVGDSLNIELQESAAFINTIYKRYAVNKESIILAGNGRGALLACSAAQLNTNIEGVIAINDAYIDMSLLRNAPRLKFTVITGDEHANFYKMDQLASLVGKKDFIADFFVYDGDAEIPEAGFLQAAITSILLEQKKDEELATAFYEKDLAFGDLLLKKQKHLSAFEFVSSLKAKYKFHLDDLTAQKALLKRIRGNARFRAKRSQRNNAQEEEYLLVEDFEYYLNEDAANAYFDNLGWWSYQMDALDTKIDSTAKNNQERKAAIRIKKYLQGSVAANAALFEGSIATPVAQKLYINVLRTLVSPDEPQGFLNAISYSAQEGDEGAALFYLEELLKMGYTDYETLYRLEGTTALRIGAPYNELIKAYLGQSKYY